jgi:hypothetical protein
MQGRGMYPEHHSRLWQSFFPAENWLADQARGAESLP